MDRAINQTLLACPQYINASNNVKVLLNNNVTFNDAGQLAIVACEMEHLKKLSTTVSLICNKYIYCIAYFIGTIGTILALCSYVFLSKFNMPVFYYYRAINAFDLIYLITYLFYGFSLYSRQSVQLVFSLLLQCLTRTCAKSSRFLVFWLAFDRSLACQWPTYYHRIDSKRVARRVILACFTVSFIYDATNWYYDIVVNCCNGSRPEVTIAILDRVCRGLEGLIMLILTPIVIAGFIQMSRRKRRLISDGQLSSVDGRASLSQINTNKWLCALQLCEGIPSILNTIVNYLSYMTNFTGLKRNTGYYLMNQNFDDNVSYQQKFEIQQYFLVLVYLVDAYNHAGHFYTYLLCSPNFRTTLLNAIKRKIKYSQVSVNTKSSNPPVSVNVKSLNKPQVSVNIKSSNKPPLDNREIIQSKI